MPEEPSAATRLSLVAVKNDQTGIQWMTEAATIDNGRIVIEPGPDQAPPRMFLRSHATFTITALDGGYRVRRFPSVCYDRSASDPPHKYVFG